MNDYLVSEVNEKLQTVCERDNVTFLKRLGPVDPLIGKTIRHVLIRYLTGTETDYLTILNFYVHSTTNNL